MPIQLPFLGFCLKCQTCFLQNVDLFFVLNSDPSLSVDLVALPTQPHPRSNKENLPS